MLTERIRSARAQHLRVWLMMTLTFVTGLVDAVGYLGLDRVFTGNMTGNIVILGMGIAGADDLPVTGPLVALGGYVVGAAITGRLLQRHRPAWEPVVTGVFACSASVLALLATVLVLVDVRGASAAGVAIATAIAALMGAQAATARALAVADMTTVVVTSTLTAYAGETLFAPGAAWLTHRRLWAILAIFTGAVAGALMMKAHISIPVYVAAVLTGVVAIVGHRAWGEP